MKRCRVCITELEENWKYCPLCGRAVSRAEKTFLDVYEEWEARHKGKVTHSTLNCYRAAKKHYSALFDMAFERIDLADLQECVDACGRGKRTRENMKALGGLLYKYALPRHLSDMNYAMFLETGEDDKKTHPAFSPEQIETIRRAAGRIACAEEIYVLIYTGFRPAELFELKKSDYCRMDGIPCLVGGMKTEAGRNRVVTVSPKISKIIERRARQADPWLFPNPKGGKMDPKTFREKYFYPALAEMRIQACPEGKAHAFYVPYSCRHTFSNLLKKVEGSDRDKADLMGHQDYQTTRRIYQSAELLAKKEITDRL